MDISSLRERSSSEAYSVTELNNYIKRLFDDNQRLSSVSVRGEISNFVNHRSGHFYFSLKDTEGQIRAVMFRSYASGLKFLPENGMKVTIHGSVSVYARDGSYQLYATSIVPDGIGALYLAYEQLKAKLLEEGLFDDDYKKILPQYPKAIGVITSPTGAAIRDIINVLGRRYPMARVYLYPSLVQGDGAEENLVAGIDYFDKSKLVDIIIIGRGGGSIEDLWAFNSEKLARRIFDCSVPVISAVGHETDFTICDFVSDMRAPTPSAAAELAVPDAKDILMRLGIALDRCDRALVNLVEKAKSKVKILSESERIRHPEIIISDRRYLIDSLTQRVERGYKDIITKSKSNIAALIGKIEALNPLSILSRGYSLAEKDCAPIKDSNDLNVGDNIRVVFDKGSILAKVLEIEN